MRLRGAPTATRILHSPPPSLGHVAEVCSQRRHTRNCATVGTHTVALRRALPRPLYTNPVPLQCVYVPSTCPGPVPVCGDLDLTCMKYDRFYRKFATMNVLSPLSYMDHRDVLPYSARNLLSFSFLFLFLPPFQARFQRTVCFELAIAPVSARGRSRYSSLLWPSLVCGSGALPDCLHSLPTPSLPACSFVVRVVGPWYTERRERRVGKPRGF